MILEEKYFSRYIIRTDQIILADCPYFGNICIVIICYPVFDVINFETKVSFLIRPFSHMTKKSAQKLKYLENVKSLNII